MKELDIPPPPAIIKSAVDLISLAATIKAEHEAGRESSRQAVWHYYEAGKALLQARHNIPHGLWLPWLKTNLPLSTQQASRYLRLAKLLVNEKVDDRKLEETWRAIDGNVRGEKSPRQKTIGFAAAEAREAREARAAPKDEGEPAAPPAEPDASATSGSPTDEMLEADSQDNLCEVELAPGRPVPLADSQRVLADVNAIWDYVRRKIIGSDRCPPGPVPPAIRPLLTTLVTQLITMWAIAPVPAQQDPTAEVLDPDAEFLADPFLER